MSTKFLAALAVASVTLASAASAVANTNILPGSAATVEGSSLYPGFDPSIAASNLINGTSTAAYYNTDPRWVFANLDADQTLTVNLGSLKWVDTAGFTYNGTDRIPAAATISISTDGVSFTPVASGPTNLFGAQFEHVDYAFANSPTQYVKFDFGANGYNPGVGIYQLNVDAVPEPATWAMLILGMGGVGAVLRRRREGAFAAA